MSEETKKTKIGYYPGCAITKCSTSEEYGTSVLGVSRVIGPELVESMIGTAVALLLPMQLIINCLLPCRLEISAWQKRTVMTKFLHHVLCVPKD